MPKTKTHICWCVSVFGVFWVLVIKSVKLNHSIKNHIPFLRGWARRPKPHPHRLPMPIVVLSLTCRLCQCVVVVDACGGSSGGGGGTHQQSDRTCHRPITRPNGYGNVTGKNFRSLTRTRDSRTREPARVLIPVSITNPCSV